MASGDIMKLGSWYCLDIEPVIYSSSFLGTELGDSSWCLSSSLDLC